MARTVRFDFYTAEKARGILNLNTFRGGLNISIGTLNQRAIPAMLAAGKRSNELDHPVVLDPVGADAFRIRDGRPEMASITGTGCTLSSASAANLAKDFDLPTSIQQAKDYLSGALGAMMG